MQDDSFSFSRDGSWEGQSTPSSKKKLEPLDLPHEREKLARYSSPSRFEHDDIGIGSLDKSRSFTPRTGETKESRTRQASSSNIEVGETPSRSLSPERVRVSALQPAALSLSDLPSSQSGGKNQYSSVVHVSSSTRLSSISPTLLPTPKSNSPTNGVPQPPIAPPKINTPTTQLNSTVSPVSGSNFGTTSQPFSNSSAPQQNLEGPVLQSSTSTVPPTQTNSTVSPQPYNGLPQPYNGAQQYNGAPQQAQQNNGVQQYNGAPQQYNGAQQNNGVQQYNGAQQNGVQQYNGAQQNNGVQQYNGAPQQYNGAPQQYNGAPQQYNGAPQQYNGVLQMNNSAPQTYNGVPQMFNGGPQTYIAAPQAYNVTLQSNSGAPQIPGAQLYNSGQNFGQPPAGATNFQQPAAYLPANELQGKSLAQPQFGNQSSKEVHYIGPPQLSMGNSRQPADRGMNDANSAYDDEDSFRKQPYDEKPPLRGYPPSSLGKKTMGQFKGITRGGRLNDMPETKKVYRANMGSSPFEKIDFGDMCCPYKADDFDREEKSKMKDYHCQSEEMMQVPALPHDFEDDFQTIHVPESEICGLTDKRSSCCCFLEWLMLMLVRSVLGVVSYFSVMALSVIPIFVFTVSAFVRFPDTILYILWTQRWGITHKIVCIMIYLPFFFFFGIFLFFVLPPILGAYGLLGALVFGFEMALAYVMDVILCNCRILKYHVHYTKFALDFCERRLTDGYRGVYYSEMWVIKLILSVAWAVILIFVSTPIIFFIAVIRIPMHCYSRILKRTKNKPWEVQFFYWIIMPLYFLYCTVLALVASIGDPLFTGSQAAYELYGKSDTKEYFDITNYVPAAISFTIEWSSHFKNWLSDAQTYHRYVKYWTIWVYQYIINLIVTPYVYIYESCLCCCQVLSCVLSCDLFNGSQIENCQEACGDCGCCDGCQCDCGCLKCDGGCNNPCSGCHLPGCDGCCTCGDCC